MALLNDGNKANTSHDRCKRCNDQKATIQIRSEPVCEKCFCQYVNTKTIKRMETYRIRGSTVKAPKKLLLPLSFGPSSTCLLSILDQHLQSQYDRMGRAAYELFVVHFDMYVEDDDRQNSLNLLEKHKVRFPRHSYSSLGLEEALRLEDIDWSSLGVSQPPSSDIKAPSTKRLQDLVGVLSSATSRADILSTLLTRLLVDVAKRHECETILFGDSTTRLAEKTLTQTAKGRGFSLPWQVSDGMSPYGVGFNYPLRDVLKKEVIAYCSLSTTPLSDMTLLHEPSNHISASSKSTTIDDLLAQYFESVEQSYPSIVANVVRTSSKLQPPSGEDTQVCGLCGLPVAQGTDGTLGWAGDQNSDSPKANGAFQTGILCYGCSRSIND